MASSSRAQSPPSFPPPKTSPPHPPTNPAQTPASSDTSHPDIPTLGKPSPSDGPSAPSNPALEDQPTPTGPSAHHRVLNATEWARIAHSLGAIRENDHEKHQVIHPTCSYWPPRGMPDGLYRDVVTERTKYAIGFKVLSTLHWFLLLVQVTLGAALTALGSLSRSAAGEATPITALAAVNTVTAGVLGLLHNSGLPERYRMDKAQFVQVEDHLREILDAGIVRADQSVEDVLDECYARLQRAKVTVLSNKPEVYSSPVTGGGIIANGKMPGGH